MIMPSLIYAVVPFTLDAYFVTVTIILLLSRLCYASIYKIVIKLEILVNEATYLLTSYLLP